MIVDDEADILTVTEISLKRVGGYEVEAFSGGEEALLAAENFTPDLVVLDVMMPGLNGPETMRKLREIASLKHVPVIFITAKAQKNEIKAYLKMGAIGVIEKPYDPMRLSEQLQKLWDDVDHDE